jgi:pyruvate kinase
MLADGLVKLTAAACSTGRVEAKVTIGGVISDRKGLALPDSRLDLPALTEKDRADLAFGLELGVDLVAASFVKNGDEIREIRDLAGGVPVIAKLELASAYKNLDDIIAAADGVMVARGDLGVELPPEQLPNVQRDILKRTNKAGLISVTATEMLESMILAPRPTRAEVTDVANAVTTGSDAVMLSAETASGNYPVAAVERRARIRFRYSQGGCRNGA